MSVEKGERLGPELRTVTVTLNSGPRMSDDRSTITLDNGSNES